MGNYRAYPPDGLARSDVSQLKTVVRQVNRLVHKPCGHGSYPRLTGLVTLPIKWAPGERRVSDRRDPDIMLDPSFTANDTPQSATTGGAAT